MGLPLVIPSAGFCSCSNLDQERPPSTFPITHKKSSAQPRMMNLPQASLHLPLGSELWRERVSMAFLLPCPRRPPDREYQLWRMSGPGEGMTPLLLEVLWDKPCLQSLGVGLTDGSLLPCPGTLCDLQGGSYEELGEAPKAQEGKSNCCLSRKELSCGLRTHAKRVKQ